jgi:hypothetical protein
MRPPIYSVHPLPSISTRPGGREPTFAGMFAELLAFLGLVPVRQSMADRIREAQTIDRLADEIQDLDFESSPAPPPESKIKTRSPSKQKP